MKYGLTAGGHLNIKMLSYQYRDSHVKDKTVSPTVLSLTWESPYLGKTVFILRRGPVWPVIAHCQQTPHKLWPQFSPSSECNPIKLQYKMLLPLASLIQNKFLSIRHVLHYAPVPMLRILSANQYELTFVVHRTAPYWFELLRISSLPLSY